jgi:hypothetical protein
MALWSPKSTDSIGPNERIGRRLFEQKQLRGAQNQKPPPHLFELYHFEERRDPGDVSVDRLGKTGIERKVLNYLERRANFAGSSFTPARRFLGWAVVSARELQNPAQGPPLSIVSSPLVDTVGNELLANNYHAHIKRPSHYTAYEMAMHLRTIFERNYHFQASQSQTAAENKPIGLKLMDWMRKNFWIRI